MLVCLAGYVPMIDQRWPPAALRMLDLPVVGSLPLTRGEGISPDYEQATKVRDPDVFLSDKEVGDWLAANV